MNIKYVFTILFFASSLLAQTDTITNITATQRTDGSQTFLNISLVTFFFLLKKTINNYIMNSIKDIVIYNIIFII